MMEAFEPFLTEYAILAEFKMLLVNQVPGVYCVPRKDDQFVWDCVLFIRQGVYNQGVFKFELRIPKGFPSSSEIPAVVFTNEIYHPQVDPTTRELNLSKKYTKWTSLCRLWHVLAFVRRQFYMIDSDVTTAVNAEAAKLFDSDQDLFKLKVAQTKRAADTSIISSFPGSSLTFSDWDDSLHGPHLQSILKKYEPDGDIAGKPPAAKAQRKRSLDERNAQICGLSWVSPTSYDSFSTK